MKLGVLQGHHTSQRPSGGGTWHWRGLCSKNGVVTVMTLNGDSSKVLDTQILTNHCTYCAQQKKRRSETDFEEWKIQHSASCEKNHEGSAGSMEPVGAQQIFRHSEEKYGLRCTSYLGDGDSKSYSSLKNADPPIYPGLQIHKRECGHVQKEWVDTWWTEWLSSSRKFSNTMARLWRGWGKGGTDTKNQYRKSKDIIEQQ